MCTTSEYHDCETSLALIEDEIALVDAVDLEATVIADDSSERLPSDMDAWDIVAATISAAASLVITTNEEFGEWLAEIHDAASEKSGDYDSIQTLLGKLFHHKGDYMDMFSTRMGDDPWRVFHRLFWGHDPLSFGGDINDNPFFLMIDQKQGLQGILQAVRHLLADTFSKQGLPIPGSSHLDYTNENERPWNYIIDLVQELSKEAYGDKTEAEHIYEHLLTIRAQDIAGGMVACALTNAYLALRGLDDDVRVAQVRLVSYTMSFFAQAIFGAAKQNGVPYVNVPLGIAMAKQSGALLVASNLRTHHLGVETRNLDKRAEMLAAQYDRLDDVMPEYPDFNLLMGGIDE